MNNSKTNLNNESTKSDFLSKIDNLTKNLTSDELLKLSNYIMLKADSSNSSNDSFNGLTILYGSQTGNSRSIAEELYDEAKKKNINSTLISMAKMKEKSIKNIENLLLIVSTQGEGDPPDDALNLVDFINGNKAPKLSKMNFGVLALGDSTYEHYCKTGKDFDAKLETLGANRVLDRVDLDVDFDDHTEQWISNALTVMEPLISSSPKSISPAFDLVAKDEKKYTRKSPLETNILTNQKITGRNSEKDIRHIEINLEESGLKYTPGDSLGVWFKNDEILAHKILSCLKIDVNEIIFSKENEPLTILDALIYEFEITQLHPGFVKKYAELTNNSELVDISNDKEKLNNFISNKQIIDLIIEYPSTISSRQLKDLLRKLTPRLYSIASSQNEVEDEVHLTVGVVQYQELGFLHTGAASGFLQRTSPNDKVKIYVESNDRFRLPENPNTPIIMIGPGTGIAPFRAFLQERAALNAKGKNWLFFGNPYFSDDFLYQTEWQDYLEEEVLEKISLAFSRDQKDKIYVQHRLLENAEEIFNWISDGAHIYICGDESRMAKDVHKALIRIISDNKKINESEAEEFLREMQKQGKYQKDVY